LIESSYFKGKEINEIFEIFIYYQGKIEEKKIFQIKNYRKSKPSLILEGVERSLDKAIKRGR